VILVPHTRLHPATARLLNRHAPGHERVRLDPADVEGYWALLAKQWRQPGDLLIVEQDIGIHADVVPSLTACRQPWCGYPYPIGEQLLVCLGCTRFTAALKAAEPDLLDVVGEDGTGGMPARCWKYLDIKILVHLRARGYTQHRHEPPVRHYRKYPQ
jgi:hypothetical protein